ncbi:hypothetical protein [Beijerinckia sp. L45]|uniref:COG3904 family protein n=1 Tax=Beijerinckia sp. L45 TaxID=1641855 RepID=UPI001AEEF456|nr:hypothetical protein [Beijerinckia sp. L45]
MFPTFIKERPSTGTLARASDASRDTAMALVVGSAAFAFCLYPLPGRLDALRLSSTAPIAASPNDEKPVDDVTTIALGPRGEDVRLSGAIAEGAAERLDILLNAHPRVTRIHLTSEGGLTDEGQRLGDVIAQHHLVTYVPDYCVSACTLLFIRGVERLMLRGARLGFHAPYDVGASGEDIVVDSSDEREAYIAAGVESAFVDAALKVSPSDIWFPEPETLVRARVATGSVGADRFPDSNLDGMDDAKGARETIVRSFPSLQAADAGDVAILDQAVAWYLSAYADGKSEATVRRKLQRYAALAEMQRGATTTGVAHTVIASEGSTRIQGVAFRSASTP